MQLLYVFLFLLLSYTIGLNICTIIARIEKNKSIIKKKKNKHDEMVLLAKTNSDSTRGLIARYLTDSYIGRNHFFLIDALIKYEDMK